MLNPVSILAAVSIDVDVTAIFMAGLFALLYLILQPLIINPYMRARQAREEGVGGAKEEASDSDAQAESMILEYEERMRKARREATEVREVLRTQGVDEQKDLIEEARAEIGAKLAQQRAELATEVESARAKLDTKAQALSRDVVEKILPALG